MKMLMLLTSALLTLLFPLFCNAQNAVQQRLYSTYFYNRLNSCAQYSETTLSGEKIEIIGKKDDRCIVIRTFNGISQACSFRPNEVTKLVEAGYALPAKKKGFFSFGGNIFNQSPEMTYWNFYKYKCREIKE